MTTGTIAILIVIAMNFTVHLVKDGEKRKDNYSAGEAFLSLIIWILLLWWAGNFG